MVIQSGAPIKIKGDSFSKQFQKEGILYVPNVMPYLADPKSQWAKFRNIRKNPQ